MGIQTLDIQAGFQITHKGSWDLEFGGSFGCSKVSLTFCSQSQWTHSCQFCFCLVIVMWNNYTFKWFALICSHNWGICSSYAHINQQYFWKGQRFEQHLQPQFTCCRWVHKHTNCEEENTPFSAEREFSFCTGLLSFIY